MVNQRVGDFVDIVVKKGPARATYQRRNHGAGFPLPTGIIIPVGISKWCESFILRSKADHAYDPRRRIKCALLFTDLYRCQAVRRSDKCASRGLQTGETKSNVNDLLKRNVSDIDGKAKSTVSAVAALQKVPFLMPKSQKVQNPRRLSNNGQYSWQ